MTPGTRVRVVGTERWDGSIYKGLTGEVVPGPFISPGLAWVQFDDVLSGGQKGPLALHPDNLEESQ